MKLKNVNATMLILASLLCLSLAFFATAQQSSNGTKNIFLDSDQDGLSDSEEKVYGTDSHNPDTDGDGYSDGAEVKAGYDPLKKAPGDKLTLESKPIVKGETTQKNPEMTVQTIEEKQNLTEKVAQEIFNLTIQNDSEDGSIGMSDIQTILDSVMNGEIFKNELPEISKDDIKILKQNYSGLSSEKAKAKKKEDVTNYSVAVLYIFTSNSPEPLTSSTDAVSILNKIIKQILSSLNSGNSEMLNDISDSGKKIYDELKEVEVPEDMVDTQIKALQYAAYSQNLKNLIKLDPTDPLSNLANYSKIETFIQNLNGFYQEIKDKLDEYSINYENVQEQLEDKGIDSNIFSE